MDFIAPLVIAALGILLWMQDHLFSRQKKAYNVLVLALTEKIAELQKEAGHPDPDTIVLTPSETLSNLDDVPFAESEND